MSSRRSTILVLALALGACDDAPERLTGPTPEAAPRASTSYTCATPSIVSPKNGVLLSGASLQLRWNVATCRTAHMVELYDDATGALVWQDASPEWRTYLENGVFVYYSDLTALQPGKFYRWRVQSKLQSDGVNPEVLGPWSGYGVFGVALSTPSTTASVQNSKPALSWGAVTGASSYQVYRKVDDMGTWETWDTASGTSYTDALTSVTGYKGTSVPTTGKWVAYKVVAVSASGIQSYAGPDHYFSYTGIIMW